MTFGINPKFLDFMPILPDFSYKAGVFTFKSLSPWALTTWLVTMGFDNMVNTSL